MWSTFNYFAETQLASISPVEYRFEYSLPKVPGTRNIFSEIQGFCILRYLHRGPLTKKHTKTRHFWLRTCQTSDSGIPPGLTAVSVLTSGGEPFLGVGLCKHYKTLDFRDVYNKGFPLLWNHRSQPSQDLWDPHLEEWCRLPEIIYGLIVWPYSWISPDG